ncbi:hypothetical protein ALP47_200150 [Pseudomonas savastanoi]|nr:hypothetical protein ALP47_200150 [Pseudomonas savastanoi]
MAAYWGCKPESQKIPSENIIRVVPGCLCYPIRFSVHIWPLNQAVFGLAASLPENNCLASIRTSTGFPPMTEISGIPAYNPIFLPMRDSLCLLMAWVASANIALCPVKND